MEKQIVERLETCDEDKLYNKKMLVSDYDQTFYLNDKDIENNKKEIKRFREQGNIFVIATGRSFLDFKNKRDLYDIQYDYVILNHGSTTLDFNDNIICNCSIDNDIIEDLKKNLKLDIAIETFCCSRFQSRVDFNYGDLTKIHVKYDNKETAMNISEKLNKKYSNYINAYFVTGDSVEIISGKTDKSLAIKWLIEELSLNKDNVWTIGDGYSDIEMIKKFKGCCMKESVPELKEVTANQFNSVSELVMKLMEESNNE